MINLLVDECFAFDYLSILEVKKNMNQDENYDNWINCLNYLKTQLGEKCIDIIKSKEYGVLYKANLSTFDAVAKARSGGNITAKEVDDCNMERYNAKVALQKVYFPESEVTERKLSPKKIVK
jgi:hypothetical protein